MFRLIWFKIRRLRYIRRLLLLFGTIRTIHFVCAWLMKKKLVEVRVRGIPTKLYVRNCDSDIHSLWSTFGEKDFDVELEKEPRLIIDVGGYVGYTSVFFAKKYPEAQVIAIEPDKENCALFRRNCREYRNIHLVEKAIWNSNTRVQIDNPGDQSWSFQVSEASSEKVDSIETITIPDLLDEFNAIEVDLLKMNIEGSEKIVFSSDCASWINKVCTMIIKTHGTECKEAVLRATSLFNFALSQHGEKMVLKKKHGF